MRAPRRTGDARVDAVIQDMARDLPRVVSCGRVDVGAAGRVVVQHGLGVKPEFYFFNRRAVTIDITDSEGDRDMWTESQIVLTASAAGTITLFVGVL